MKLKRPHHLAAVAMLKKKKKKENYLGDRKVSKDRMLAKKSTAPLAWGMWEFLIANDRIY